MAALGFPMGNDGSERGRMCGKEASPPPSLHPCEFPTAHSYGGKVASTGAIGRAAVFRSGRPALSLSLFRKSWPFSYPCGANVIAGVCVWSCSYSCGANVT